MKRQFIYGNWKMAQTLSGLKLFLESLKSLKYSRESLDLAIFPSYLHLKSALDLCEQNGLALGIGAQDLSTEKQGAFTGEVSAKSLAELHCGWVLIGHSERRRRLPESPATLAQKLKWALDSKLKVVFCLGETEAERVAGQTLEILKAQFEVLKESLSLFSENGSEQGENSLLIAYEPVWAIGTGKVASAQDIAEAHLFLRAYSRKWSDMEIPLLYGGSVSPKNATEILRISEVNGVLVGGASLKAEDFRAIAESSPFFAL